MMPQEPNSFPSDASDDALAKMIFKARTTVHGIPSSSAEIADRVCRFNELYEALPAKPDAAALIYRDPVTGSPMWSAIGDRLLVGRSPKVSAKIAGALLSIRDDEMSRQHFEVVLTNDELYLLNDLDSLNGTYVNGVRQETAVLIGGSEIRAGKTIFIFSGV